MGDANFKQRLLYNTALKKLEVEGNHLKRTYISIVFI